MVLGYSALLIAASVFAQTTAQSTCTLSESETCAVESFASLSEDGSVLVYPGGNTRCAFDDYSDPVTGFTTNSTYFFQVFPNTNHDKSKLMIFFQGGGGCTDENTCAFGLECSLAENAFFTTVATVRGAGVIDRSMVDNMFKDWNVVFVPYCTGDVHTGNKVFPPFESGIEKSLGNPQCLGKNFSMHMNGYNNSKSALDWARQNFPDVDNLVVGGASAGSLGAQFFSAQIADMWDVDARGTRFSVMADSYVGVLPESHPVPALLRFFGACENGLAFPPDIAAVCNAKNASVVDLVDALIEDQPDSKWLFVNSKDDEVQRYYYALVAEGIQGYPFPNLMSEEELYRNMSAILDAYQMVSPHISTFYVEGNHHVFLMDKNFTSYKSDAGLYLGDVINEWLASNVSLGPAAITRSASNTLMTTSTTRAETKSGMVNTNAPDSAPIELTTTPSAATPSGC
ncbi:Carbohydrate esterase [Phytophthora cinnamomi]|uniref:Carbohydrate esterase n=1 Tax=Phytophthora cinnamomi TaxID=4785 RepID=UPI003559E066|nr:Carbohydrate esterase [Phytophthora cinnamomi]